MTQILLEKEITGIAYETVQLQSGYLPLLAPMSEVAGRMSVQIGANHCKTMADLGPCWEEFPESPELM